MLRGGSTCFIRKKKPNLPSGNNLVRKSHNSLTEGPKGALGSQLQLNGFNSNSISYWVHTEGQILRWAVISITLLKSQNGAEEVWSWFSHDEKTEVWKVQPLAIAHGWWDGDGWELRPPSEMADRDTQAHLRHRLTQPPLCLWKLLSKCQYIFKLINLF